MHLIYPRLMGGLCLLWAVILQRGALPWPSDLVWAIFTLAWLAASTFMVIGRSTSKAALALAALSLLFVASIGSNHHSPSTLIFWLCLTIGLTEGQPINRALLIRVTVTTAYIFAALAKINPSFLSGEHLAGLAASRPQLRSLEPLFRSAWRVPVSLAVIAAEAFLAIGLWFRRTRLVAVAIGIVAHLGFIVVANNGTRWDIAYVTVLNGGLVISYLMFFSPLREGNATEASAPIS